MKRTHLFSTKFIVYLITCLSVLVASWESSINHKAFASESIPSESIRLRILANSDMPADQLLKRDIRDRIVASMNEWVKGPETLEEARVIVGAQLPELEAQVGAMLAERGLAYPYKVELGSAPFPTKVYGSRVYPAGDYEALVVTIGTGEGQNWWCVLFPPLCFVDIVGGKKKQEKAAAAAGVEPADLKAAQEDPEVRLFLVDLAKKLGSQVGKMVKR